MTEEQKTIKELLLAFYQENASQCRHHETLRANVTSTIIAIDSIVIGLITLGQKISPIDRPLTIFLILLGLFGMIISLKHYERYKFHSGRCRQYRTKLDKLFTNGLILELQEEAKTEHEKSFFYLYKMRNYQWWAAIHLIVVVIGIILTLFSIKGYPH